MHDYSGTRQSMTNRFALLIHWSVREKLNRVSSVQFSSLTSLCTRLWTKWCVVVWRMLGGGTGGSVRRACSARAVGSDVTAAAHDATGRSYSLAPPLAASERCSLRRQHSAGTASSCTLGPEDNTIRYGTVNKTSASDKSEQTSGFELSPQKQRLSPGTADGSAGGGGDPAVIISGRYLAVSGGGAAWERRTSSPSFTSSGDVGLRPDDDIQPSSPGSPSAGRFRFRYSRSFTFRRSVSSSSAGNGSRRGSTSPDKGRRAVQVFALHWYTSVKPKFHYVDFTTKSADFVADLFVDFFRVLSGNKFHYNDTNGFVADLSRTVSQVCNHLDMSRCRFSPMGSFYGKVSVKIGVMEFGLKLKELETYVP